MKRFICLLLALVTVCSLWACRKETEEFVHPVQFYYYRTEPTHGAQDSYIAPETREAGIHHKDLAYLLDLYLKGPASAEFSSPFPAGTTLIRTSLANNTLTITLSDDFAQLSGIDLSVACACLTKTGMTLSGAARIEIQAQNALLDGKEKISMSKTDLILLDESAATTE